MTTCKKGINASIINPTGIIGPHDYKPSRMGKVIIDMHRPRSLENSIRDTVQWLIKKEQIKL